MSLPDPKSAYLDLANKLFENVVSEHDLPTFCSQLPSINEDLLQELALHAEEAGLSEPRRGWAIMAIGDSATSSQNCNLLMQSKAAWYLGHACNEWARPSRVIAAIGRARDGFVALNDPGWMAACDWQLNALSWVKPDLLQVANTLRQALEVLRDSTLLEFVPHCILALAYVQILIGELDQAKENIQESESIFSALGDILNQARCWRMEASYFRRLAQFNEAIIRLGRAMETFSAMKAPLDVAKVHYQLGLIHLLRTDDLAIALSHLKQASIAFARGDLDLWQAACTTNMGSIYTQYGDLSKADECIKEARAIFIEHNVLGLLADNLNDSGKLYALRGYPISAIDMFKQAERIYGNWGAPLPAAIQMANLGEVYGQVGRYQDALLHLERSADRLKLLNNPLRLGTCENYSALIWWRLGQLSLAHEYLDKATVHYKEAKQIAYFSLVLNFRASLFFEQGELRKAIDCLKDSLEIAEASKIRPHAALARRLLGEAYLRIGEYQNAKNYLEQAHNEFFDMEMTMELAATLVSLGSYYLQVSEFDKARSAFKRALRVSKNSYPEIDWRAHVGQASLAELRGEVDAGVKEYHWGEEAISKVRLNFWQPALAGSYLHSPSRVFDKAVHLANQAGSPDEVLLFIENNKATTLLRQLTYSGAFPDNKDLQELKDLRAEINWLQEQLRVSHDRTNIITSSMRFKQIHNHMVEKVKRYDSRMSQIERQSVSDLKASILPIRFDLSVFRNLLESILGKSWAALDYYLTEEELVISVISPDSCQSQSNALSYRIKLALEECQKACRNVTSLAKSDLMVLGDFLIPQLISDRLTPETFLMLAPHRKLHGLPWGAIQPSVFSQPLSRVCIPSIIPSLHSLALLCNRSISSPIIDRNRGLIVGLSEFQGTRQRLPYVRKEIDDLQSKLGPGGELLRDSEANWKNIQGLVHTGNSSSPEGLSRYAWLHIASHVFPDVHTGRLSGIALWDEDVWLDHLSDLSPLPRMMTFSACNSIHSVIYEGDEHVGLPTTCLSSGANSVIGSIRPIQDRLATEFMVDFYGHYMDGMSPSKAVAQTQRQMIAGGIESENWASFISVGVP